MAADALATLVSAMQHPDEGFLATGPFGGHFFGNRVWAVCGAGTALEQLGRNQPTGWSAKVAGVAGVVSIAARQYLEFYHPVCVGAVRFVSIFGSKTAGC